MSYFAICVSQGPGGPFRVSGGPFTREQTMGWHITDGRGFTVAVSCDEGFVQKVLAALNQPDPAKTDPPGCPTFNDLERP